MKVRVEYSGAKNDPGVDYDERCEVLVEGESIANLGNMSECPEDANLGRDFRFLYDLPDLLRKVHEAGKNGEPFEIEEIENAE